MTPATKTKILVVEDDSKVLRAIRSHLENLGYEVATAEDGAAALKLARSMSPDLIVLDLNFSDFPKSIGLPVDGIEVLLRLRESSRIPVLIMSGTNISSVKDMALSIGGDDYISKPFEPQALSARIEAILGRTGKELPDGTTGG